jgi:Zn-dependent protease with chaperone function
VIIAGDEVNAFAHVGGYVYLHKGMLDFAESDAELQFVLAHEIAHIELGHCAWKVTYAARAAEIGGGPAATLAQQAYLMIASGYSQEDEFEADAWAYRTMREIGRSREETLAFFHRYVVYSENRDRPLPRREPRNVYEKAALEIIDHFHTHPPPRERLARLESLEM